MERYNHKTIDPIKWDNLVLSSANGLFYHISGILFSLNKNWEFYVEVGKHGNYISGIPLPVNKFFGLKRIIQPAFCQQLGSLGKENNNFLKLIDTGKLIEGKILSFRYHFNEGNNAFQSKTNNNSWRLGRNLVLNLGQSMETIRNNYSTNLKRKLKLSFKSGLNFQASKREVLWPLMRKELLVSIDSISKSALSNLYKIFLAPPEGLAFHFFEVCNPNKEVLAGGVFAGFKNRFTYWAGFSTAKGKELGGMAFLIDNAIAFSSDSHKEFDFESGNLQGTSRFFTQFKPEERSYPIYNK